MSKKQHHEEHVDETWLIPYADMLTLLLALFIVMFAVSQVDKEKLRQISQQFNIVFSSGSGLFESERNVLKVNPEDMYSDGSKVEGDSSNKEDTGSKKSENIEKLNEEAKSLQQKYEAEDKSMQDIKNQLEEVIKEEGYQDKITIGLTQNALEISIQEKILFNSGDAVVHGNVTPILGMISKILSTIDNNVKIVGHTDNIPISNSKFRSNWDLSAIRAINVMHYLSGASNISPARFTVQGNAEFSPKADNNTEMGRQQNRRVEIFIIRMHKL